MKVNVLTINDVKINKFRWWSNWIDVSVYDYASTPFLLQMKISRTNKKKFRSVRMTGVAFYRQCTTSQVGDLTQMKKD